MAKDKLLEESVRALKFLLPKGWEEEGRKTKGSNRLRGFKSGLQILQVLLLHVGQGYSLRETAAVSQAGGLAEISDVGILKRLRKSEEWLRRLCELLTEGASNNKGIVMPGRQLRIVDGTSVKEPGKTGSEWLVHFSMRLPILHCDDLKITPKRGAGNGEYLSHYSVEKGDTFLADAGYFHPRGIRHVTSQGGDVLIRASISGWKIRDSMSQTLNIPKTLSSTLRKGGETGEWDVEFGKEGTLVKGRLCVMRKSSHAITQMNSRLKRKGKKIISETALELSKYVLLFTTLPKSEFSTEEILSLYRTRWQIELSFKRVKSLMQVGHVPKKDPTSARAWLYAKFLIALLVQKWLDANQIFFSSTKTALPS